MNIFKKIKNWNRKKKLIKALQLITAYYLSILELDKYFVSLKQKENNFGKILQVCHWQLERSKAENEILKLIQKFECLQDYFSLGKEEKLIYLCFELKIPVIEIVKLREIRQYFVDKLKDN